MNTVAAARTASTAPTSSVSAVSFTPPAALLNRHYDARRAAFPTHIAKRHDDLRSDQHSDSGTRKQNDAYGAVGWLWLEGKPESWTAGVELELLHELQDWSQANHSWLVCPSN